MGVVKEWQSMAEQVGDQVDLDITDEEKDKVRRLICANSVGDSVADQAADAELLMLALGVHPDQDKEDVYAVLSLRQLNSAIPEAGRTPL